MRFPVAIISLTFLISAAHTEVYKGNYPDLEETVFEIENSNFHKKSSLKGKKRGEVFSSLGITGSIPEKLVSVNHVLYGPDAKVASPGNISRAYVYIKTDFRYEIIEPAENFKWTMFLY